MLEIHRIAKDYRTCNREGCKENAEFCFLVDDPANISENATIRYAGLDFDAKHCALIFYLCQVHGKIMMEHHADNWLTWSDGVGGSRSSFSYTLKAKRDLQEEGVI